MKFEKSKNVYVCCGQYYVTTTKTENVKPVCPKCKGTPVKVRTPIINIITGK